MTTSPADLVLVQDLLDQLHSLVAEADKAAAALQTAAVATAHQQLAGLVGRLRDAGASAATMAGVRRRIEHHYGTLQYLSREIAVSLERLGLATAPRYSAAAELNVRPHGSLHHGVG